MYRKKSIIRGVLEEELERNGRIQSRQIKELDSLPKGSLLLRKIGGNEYYYLKYRDGNRVVAKYIGAKQNVNLNEFQKSLAKRKHMEQILKDLRNEEKEIRKALR